MGPTRSGDNPQDLLRTLRSEVENKIHWPLRDGPASTQPIAAVLPEADLQKFIDDGEASEDQLQALGQMFLDGLKGSKSNGKGGKGWCKGFG